MPVYIYRNLETGETFEYEQRITEDALTVHPETGQPVKRLVQPVGIAFKGSGFYVNDTRKASGSGSSAKATDSASKAASKDSAASAASTPATSGGSGGASGN